MDSYIDITVLPDPEFSSTTLINAVFAKLHRVLMKVAQGRIGVSFPSYKNTLGKILRIHGCQMDLGVLLAEPWLKGLGDYTQVSEIQPVPAGCAYRTVYREHTKSAHNKLKRSLSKGWITEEEAAVRFKTEQSKTSDLPFANVKSLSTGEQIRIFIGLGDLQGQPTKGEFSSYGLSKTATVPWF